MVEEVEEVEPLVLVLLSGSKRLKILTRHYWLTSSSKAYLPNSNCHQSRAKRDMPMLMAKNKSFSIKICRWAVDNSFRDVNISFRRKYSISRGNHLNLLFQLDSNDLSVEQGNDEQFQYCLSRRHWTGTSLELIPIVSMKQSRREKGEK